jgi:hypothetical protein
MLIMAIRALDLSFKNRMMRLLGDLHFMVAMTGNAKIWLRSLEIHLLTGVGSVTTIAGNIGGFMTADIPVGKTT